ncbi:glycogen debranching protein [Robiginitalea sp.]|uniref:alpha-L-rhamnosidase-related protein n=1 Tax=Robiginitalea sp. TaxID=1902411 RepID=UPI003C73A691
MSLMRYSYSILFALLCLGCSKERNPVTDPFEAILDGSSHISGSNAYLNSPFVTAGDRVYMVGHQDGSFPELGWHIKGEMGGIWNHPVKLMDGFEAVLIENDRRIPLEKASAFVNFPMANQHLYTLEGTDLEVVRWQFVPDGKQGLVVQYTLKNTGAKDRTLTFEFTGFSDLRPTWLGERSGMQDHPDRAVYHVDSQTWRMTDTGNSWHVIFGAGLPVSSQEESKTGYAGQGRGGKLRYVLDIPQGGTQVVNFVIAGSYTSESEAQATYTDLQQNSTDLLRKKSERYQRLAAKSKLTTPDSLLNQTFEWLKYNSDWLIREVPEIGRGITAGIPDYPWWFGVDSEYALQGYMAIGQDEIVHQTIHLIDSVSEAVNGNGKIIHEMSTNGVVFNPGNINETPQFATLIWRIYQWNGDKEFLKKYFPTIQKGLGWLMAENDGNNNSFPDGFGMMEIHGLNSEMIDVAVYTQAAFADAGHIAAALGEEGLASEYRKRASALQEKINREFWSEEFQSYADFIGTDEQALHLIDDAIIRADTLDKPWAVKELEQTREAILRRPSGAELKPFVLHHNWVVNTPMEMGIADPEKAEAALETARNFVNPFGMFVTGIDRDNSAGTDEGSFKGSNVFSYTGAVMTLPTGVQAIAENNYGHPDRALDYLKRMTRSFSYALPGSMYEVSPDYGMIVQAWNIYSFAVPIIGQFFGIQPRAAEKKIIVHPLMPREWDQAHLENVQVGRNAISVYYQVEETGTTLLKITQKKQDWTLRILLDGVQEKELQMLEGTVIKQQQHGTQVEIEARGSTLEVRYKTN